LDWDLRRPARSRSAEIEAIVDFVSRHRNSYASLAVCRRALDSGLEAVDDGVIEQLRAHLAQAPGEELDAYYSIVM